MLFRSVYTAVTIINAKKEESWIAYAEVKFRQVTEDKILSYIETNEPLDKAGSYAIQGLGAFLVESYYGNYQAIVGFPVDEVLEKLKDF